MISSLAHALLLASIATASACLNISGVNLDGHEHTHGERTRQYTRAHLLEKKLAAENWAARLPALEAAMAQNPTIRQRSDYGGVLVYLGEYAKARDVLLEAERVSPGDYAVASNLGTAYELLGENTKALEWIQAGMQRDPASHEGTEWVHVKILEAKMALARDPHWLLENSVLGVDFGSDDRPRLMSATSIHQQEELERIMRGAGYQLRERLQFARPPEDIVSNVLFDLGNAVAVAGDVGVAEEVYGIAWDYAAEPSHLLRIRRDFMREIGHRLAAKKSRTIWLIGLGLLAIGFALYRWMRARSETVHLPYSSPQNP